MLRPAICIWMTGIDVTKMAKVTTSVAVNTRIWMTELYYVKGHYLCCFQHRYLDDKDDKQSGSLQNAAVSNLYLDDQRGRNKWLKVTTSVTVNTCIWMA